MVFISFWWFGLKGLVMVDEKLLRGGTIGAMKAFDHGMLEVVF